MSGMLINPPRGLSQPCKQLVRTTWRHMKRISFPLPKISGSEIFYSMSHTLYTFIISAYPLKIHAIHPQSLTHYHTSYPEHHNNSADSRRRRIHYQSPPAANRAAQDPERNSFASDSLARQYAKSQWWKGYESRLGYFKESEDLKNEVNWLMDDIERVWDLAEGS